ncbi:hypothetical protein [Bacillus sp. REN10]|uniref:hypothetical protein n=1 Tax=Bacillus sp. REN10 TaxID=2782541 RepID=UPI00193BFDB6|nr:hypothetical protein [Bacillus sp. REN10]
MNVSESMLTYRKEDGGSTLVAGAYSWTRKAETTVQTRQANDRMTEWRSSAMQSGWHLTRVSRRRSWTTRKAEGARSSATSKRQVG